MKKAIVFASIFLLTAQLVNGQVLISLIFGDMLNSPTVKFGLDGGLNYSTITHTGSSKYTEGFHLGFYFDILLKKDMNWYIHTGVIVKSPLGTRDIDPYSLNNQDMDSLFTGGSVDRKLRYFNVPILVRYKTKWNVFAEVGPMMGLLYKANDVFYNKIEKKDDLSYTKKVYNQYKWFDIGIMGGVGYQLQVAHGMNLGIRYYYGFMDILKDNPGKPQNNSSFYAYVSIPIGAGDKAKAKAAEREKKRQEKKAAKNSAQDKDK